MIKNISIKKIINILIVIFVFLIPWQTRYIYRQGLLNGGVWEYGTLSIYGLEILIWIIVLFFAYDNFRKKEFWNLDKNNKHKKQKKKYLIFLFFFLIINAINIIISIEKDISYQHWIWILEGMCISVVIISSTKIYGVKRFHLLISLWLAGLVQSLLAIFQFFTQKVFSCKWLGMASQNPSDSGVSIIQFADERWLRSYGSLSWPNMLGGFLAVCLIVGLIIIYNNNFKDKRIKIFFAVSQLIILFGLILSFSRASWIAVCISLLTFLYLVYKNKKEMFEEILKHILVYSVFVLSSIILLAPLFNARFDLNNSVERVSYIEHKEQYLHASKIIEKEMLLGTGQGAYTLYLYNQYPKHSSWMYQPIHNIYFLLFTEMGILGFCIFSILFIYLIKKIYILNPIYLPLILVVLIHGIFDHWYWTLYVGIIFWWVVFALSLQKNIDTTVKTE